MLALARMTDVRVCCSGGAREPGRCSIEVLPSSVVTSEAPVRLSMASSPSKALWPFEPFLRLVGFLAAGERQSTPRIAFNGS